MTPNSISEALKIVSTSSAELSHAVHVPFFEHLTRWLGGPHWVQALEGCLLLIFCAWLINFLVKKVLIKGVTNLIKVTPLKNIPVIGHYHILDRMANIAPALVLFFGIKEVPYLPLSVATVVIVICNVFFILIVAMILSKILDFINELWQRRPIAAHRPIKGYLQVLKILIYCVCIILIISDLIGKSPLILLSGLGAMAAVLMLIFQDTILSLVAGVQISSNNMIKIGDWIEMPQLGADGDVIDISLHTVKVQNWDKTISTIPIKKFVSDSFKNWRGMEEAGGRRIKRSLYLDQNSIHFLSEEEERHLERFRLLNNYLNEKKQEIEEWNSQLKDHNNDEINYRRVTNIGTFRAYVLQYLKNHPKIHQEMTLLVRQLPLTSQGLPLELYCFTNDIRWAAYEDIQSDIFDHLLAILPEFGLKVFQEPSGADLSHMFKKH